LPLQEEGAPLPLQEEGAPLPLQEEGAPLPLVSQPPPAASTPLPVPPSRGGFFPLGASVSACFDFTSEGPGELSIAKGERLIVHGNGGEDAGGAPVGWTLVVSPHASGLGLCPAATWSSLLRSLRRLKSRAPPPPSPRHARRSALQRGRRSAWGTLQQRF